MRNQLPPRLLPCYPPPEFIKTCESNQGIKLIFPSGTDELVVTFCNTMTLEEYINVRNRISPRLLVRYPAPDCVKTCNLHSSTAAGA